MRATGNCGMGVGGCAGVKLQFLVGDQYSLCKMCYSQDIGYINCNPDNAQCSLFESKSLTVGQRHVKRVIFWLTVV